MILNHLFSSLNIMNCLGNFKNNCQNVAVIGYELCAECNKLRLNKLKEGLCTRNGSCPNETNQGYSWCQLCYLKDKINKVNEIFKHDCSYRGGVACSICDEQYSSLEQLNKKIHNLENKKRTYHSKRNTAQKKY